MQLIFFVDNRGWAFDHIAQNLCVILKGFNPRIVYTEDFRNTFDFIGYLEKNVTKETHLHFFWRGYLFDSLKFLIYLGKAGGCALGKINQCVVTTHIPDCLYSTHEELRSGYGRVLDYVNGYFVTSEKLLNHYRDVWPGKKPYGKIYDVALVGKKGPVKEKARAPKLKAVWIGNSKWGEHLGYKDYKGFHSVILPVFERLRNSGENVELTVYDKSIKAASHQEIIGSLENSDLLVIASEEEGTPLPLVEAMSNGCAVVTTDVGIVSEVLPDVQKPFVLKRSSDDFYKAVMALAKDNDLLLSCKNANVEAYNNIWGDGKEIKEQWAGFIQKSSSNNNVSQKNDVVASIASTSWVKKKLFILALMLSGSRIKEYAKKFRFLSYLFFSFKS
ncbi:glycosyltransferase [Alcanivorax jadensis]|jgi:Glycosyl transferases group 1|uniref:glycosyltransferase n=1 Tax=Alcanivorax jadensis TaxID=64988 RepID=UPI0024098D5E|nr:glycosyltransferase family 4 protein [Alcanivorax jadensis]MDF1638700.1 glycosyltransferase family 4 protein [Alcanivorax jadensis]|tara:strand:+ start:1146 stop:2309 length:1164 start_codon:yes stop_codon:yes gene_type:complete